MFIVIHLLNTTVMVQIAYTTVISALLCISFVIYRKIKNWGRYSDWLWAGCQRGWNLSPDMGKTFLLSVSSKLVLWPTQPLIHWVQGAVSMRVKQPEHEADHSLPTSGKINV
jgi:hypothetical protein